MLIMSHILFSFDHIYIEAKHRTRFFCFFFHLDTENENNNMYAFGRTNYTLYNGTINKRTLLDYKSHIVIV